MLISIYYTDVEYHDISEKIIGNYSYLRALP